MVEFRSGSSWGTAQTQALQIDDLEQHCIADFEKLLDALDLSAPEIGLLKLLKRDFGRQLQEVIGTRDQYTEFFHRLQRLEPNNIPSSPLSPHQHHLRSNTTLSSSPQSLTTPTKSGSSPLPNLNSPASQSGSPAKSTGNFCSDTESSASPQLPAPKRPREASESPSVRHKNAKLELSSSQTPPGLLFVDAHLSSDPPTSSYSQPPSTTSHSSDFKDESKIKQLLDQETRPDVDVFILLNGARIFGFECKPPGKVAQFGQQVAHILGRASVMRQDKSVTKDKPYEVFLVLAEGELVSFLQSDISHRYL